MQILSVTEHINSLNRAIDHQVEFINNVERMRKLQLEYNREAFDFNHHDDLETLEKLVDDFLARRNKGGSNDAPR